MYDNDPPFDNPDWRSENESDGQVFYGYDDDNIDMLLERLIKNEDSVTINVSSGGEVTVYCGDDEEYSKGVFNLLMDIKDRLAQE